MKEGLDILLECYLFITFLGSETQGVATGLPAEAALWDLHPYDQMSEPIDLKVSVVLVHASVACNPWPLAPLS